MLTTEEKLRHFSQSVFARARKQADEIIEKADCEAKEKVEQYEMQCLEKAYQNIQVQIRKIRRQSREAVSKMSLEAKRELFKNREAMVDEIFSQVAARLEAFRQSGDYLSFLKQAVTRAQAALESEALRVFIDEKDQALLSPLRLAFHSCTFETAPPSQHMLGGICAAEPKADKMADFSLAAALRAERNRFLTESGFVIS